MSNIKKTAKTGKSKSEPRPNRRREKPKAFERYEQDHPIQLNLFQILEPENQKYSNTVEIYDFLPKEYLGKASRVADTYLPRLEREFDCRGKRYKMETRPGEN